MKAIFKSQGDVIVITGGANGIGRALAHAASEAGASVIVCDRDETAMSSLREENAHIKTVPLDVSDRERVLEVFGEIERSSGSIDGLVCAAAVQPRVKVADIDPVTWRRVVDVNLNGVVWCYQAVIRGMIARRRGSIIAFSSGLAHQGWPEASAYSATKAALIAFVKSAAKEVAKHRVRVNLVWPGVIDTPQYRAANPAGDHNHWQATTGVGQPADVVGPLMFLLSDAATMTASVLSRDFVYSAVDPEQT